MRGLSILVLHCLCSLLGAGNNKFAKKHCYFENSNESD